MAITPDDVAAWQRDGLDLGDAADRQVLADQFLENRTGDPYLLDDHADLLGMVTALADQALGQVYAMEAERTPTGRRHRRTPARLAKMEALRRQREALWSFLSVLRKGQGWSKVRRDDRPLVEEAVRDRGHIVETVHVATGKGRSILALLIDGRQVTGSRSTARPTARTTREQMAQLAELLEPLGELQIKEWHVDRGCRSAEKWRLYVDIVRKGDDDTRDTAKGYVDLLNRVFTMDTAVPNVLRAKVQQVRDVIEAWRDQVGG